MGLFGCEGEGEVEMGEVYEIQEGRAMEVKVRATAVRDALVEASWREVCRVEREGSVPARKTQRPIP